MWVLFDWINSRDRIQHYWFKWLNWLTVSIDEHTVDITRAESYNLPIEWSFLVGKWLYYNYFNYDNGVFTVNGTDLIEAYDKIIVWHRIPYWVDRISEVYVNGVKLDYLDSRDFYINTIDHYTVIKDYQWNSYLYLPFSDREYSVTVKYVPDGTIMTMDDDIVDIEYKYTRVVVYDIAYRLLASREDDRWKYYEAQLEKMEKKYKWYKARATKRTNRQIWIAPVFDFRTTRQLHDILPDGVYDPYIN